jgi:hypothetical protein
LGLTHSLGISSFFFVWVLNEYLLSIAVLFFSSKQSGTVAAETKPFLYLNLLSGENSRF